MNHGGLMNQSLQRKIASLAILLMPLSGIASDGIKKVVTFDSTWDIFWGEFIEPKAWDTSTTRRPDETASLLNLDPSNSTSNPKRYRFATFRKVLDLPKNEKPYAIYFPVLRGASKVWINKRLVLEEGVPGSSYEQETEKMKVNIVTLKPGENSLDIVIHHSSFHFYLMGHYAPILIGPAESIVSHKNNAILRDVFVFSSILIMSFYHFALYLLRRERKGPLYFGIFCLSLMVITGVRGEGTLIFKFFDNPNTQLFYRCDFAAFPIAVAIMMVYCRNLYPDQVWKTMVKAQIYASAVFLFSVLFLPTYYAELLLIPFQSFSVLLGLILLGRLAYAAYKKEEGAVLFCLGFAAILGGAINDILALQGIADTIVISHMTLFSFILLQSILLSKRFSKDFTMLEIAKREIRVLNEGLEQKVQERTKTIRMILDNVKSGFLLVDRSLTIQEGFTKSCPSILGQTIAAGDDFSRLFDLNDRDLINFKLSIDQIFDDIFPEEVSINQVKNRLPIGDKQIKLQMAAVRDENNNIAWLLITVTDATHLAKMEHEAKLSKTLLKILQSQINFKSLLKESLRDLESSKSLIDQEEQKDIRILLHTLKGNFAAYGLDDIAQIIHKIEDVERINIENLVGIVDAIKGFLEAHGDILQLNPDNLDEKTYNLHEHDFLSLNEQLKRNGASSQLLDACSKWIENAKRVSFSDLVGPIDKNAVRIAKGIGKDITLSLEGEHEAVDPEKIQYVVHSLIHLIRNSIDHGIEPPEERNEKPEQGHIFIKVSRDPDLFYIDIGDDGRGIDAEVIKTVALNKGLISNEQAREMSESDLLKMIFKPGFSTRDEVSSLSGRGVGMSALEEAVLELRGSIEIETKKGQGTIFHIAIPEDSEVSQAA